MIRSIVARLSGRFFLLVDFGGCSQDGESERYHKKHRNPVGGIPRDDSLFSHFSTLLFPYLSGLCA
jgi:hypothetical protein